MSACKKFCLSPREPLADGIRRVVREEIAAAVAGLLNGADKFPGTHAHFAAAASELYKKSAEPMRSAAADLEKMREHVNRWPLAKIDHKTLLAEIRGSYKRARKTLRKAADSDDAALLHK